MATILVAESDAQLRGALELALQIIRSSSADVRSTAAPWGRLPALGAGKPSPVATQTFAAAASHR
jgi:hypothetical protein